MYEMWDQIFVLFDLADGFWNGNIRFVCCGLSVAQKISENFSLILNSHAFEIMENICGQKTSLNYEKNLLESSNAPNIHVLESGVLNERFNPPKKKSYQSKREKKVETYSFCFLVIYSCFALITNSRMSFLSKFVCGNWRIMDNLIYVEKGDVMIQS